MREFQDRRRRSWRRLIASRLVQIFLILILILMGESVAQLYQRERVVAKEEEAVKHELALLEAKRAELSVEVTSLETDRGVEEALRERFGVVKEGEKVINLVGVTATSTETTTTNSSWWQKVVDWLR